MKGHIRQRGKRSFELKFDAGRDPATGKRKIQYISFKGTKREAQVKLAELIASVGKGAYVEPHKVDGRRLRACSRRPVGSRRRHLGADSAALSTTGRAPNRTAPRRKAAAEAYTPRCRGVAHNPAPRWPGLPHHRPCAPGAVQGAGRRGT